MQHHQLHKQFQALQFFCHPHPSLCCKTWTLLASYEKGTEAFETKCMRKLLRVSYLEHKTNDWVRSKINFFVGPQEPLLATVSSGNCLFWQLSLLATAKGWKIAWLGHVTRHDSLSKTILSGHLGGWVTPWSAEEMLDGQQQRVDIPVHTRTAHKGHQQKRLEDDLC